MGQKEVFYCMSTNGDDEKSYENMVHECKGSICEFGYISGSYYYVDLIEHRRDQKIPMYGANIGSFYINCQKNQKELQ